jgi:Xaa-Pro aminopeptidase
MEWKPAPLVAGMTITDEPGIYLPDRCGARTENTLLIVPYKETEFGKFLQFESLTLCPIDKSPIIKEMLLQEEVDWLNDYHRHVAETLSPYLSEADIYSRIMYIELDVFVVIIGVFFCVMIDAGTLRTLNGA